MVFAIAFDLVVADTAKNHPKGVSQSYADIGSVLSGYRFTWMQGSVYLTHRDDLANLFAIMALKSLPWFPPSVRDLRAFKVEHWSDFTQIIKG